MHDWDGICVVLCNDDMDESRNVAFLRETEIVPAASGTSPEPVAPFDHVA
jgi:hypothetical protein